MGKSCREVALDEFPIGVSRQGGDSEYTPWLFVGLKPGTAPCDDLIGIDVFFQNHENRYLLPQHRIRPADHRRFCHRGVSEDDRFNLCRINIGAAPNNDIAGAPQYGQKPLPVEKTDISRVYPSIDDKIGQSIGIQIYPRYIGGRAGGPKRMCPFSPVANGCP